MVDDEVVLERVSRGALTEVAPDEAATVSVTVEAFAAQGGRLPTMRTAEDRLGFGLAGVIEAVAPVVVLVANEALKTLVSEATKGAGNAARRRLVAALRHWAQKPEEPSPVSLSAEEQEQIRAVARSAALRHGLSEDRADAVVDSVMKALPGAQK